MPNKEIKIVRTHDELYAKIDSKVPNKELFVEVASFIKNYKNNTSRNISVADIGCANGAFVNYLTSYFSEDKIVGYEYLHSLVKVGKKNFPNIEIKQASVLDRGSIVESNFDVITILGVLSIFDDIEPVVSNLVHWTKPGGKIFIHGLLNPDDVDVFIKYRSSENYGIPEHEAGWNIISQKTLAKVVTNNGGKNLQFHEFNLSIDLKKNFSDPVRGWTEKLENNRKQVVNGLCIKQPQFTLEFDI